MQMTDSQRIPAPRSAVWAALNDPDVLRRCIPGCESLEMTSPTAMTAAVVVKVGPVKAKFGGKVTLSDIDAPNGYRISGEGSGGVAGFAKGGATVRLEEDGPETTILHYDVDAQVGGKLAQLGGRLIDSTAKKLAGMFFESFAAAVASEPADAAPDTTTAGMPASETPVPDTPVGAKKKGWFGRLFSRTATTASAVVLIAAAALFAHSCCLFQAHAFPGHMQTGTWDGFPVCRGVAS
jgi:carbon monoxide dehydrogenase subunit G